MTVNDAPEPREIFAGFEIEEASVTYISGTGNRRRTGELIISDGR